MVVPVEQTCPKCKVRFMGSDMVGMRCKQCTNPIDPAILAAIIAQME